MNELSLFTGAGGGVLGTSLLGFTHVGYVEVNDYCQQIIAARIKDGFISNAPLFSDIKAFNREGYAASYTGLVDIITAGFPCQPYSQIGKHKADQDERNLWPETLATIKTVQPGQVLLENTKGLLTKGYILDIIQDLFGAGYTVWPVLQFGAYCCGASHKRERIWLYAEKSRVPVVFADDCRACEGCGEPYCAKCERHYYECECPGPTEDDIEYSQDGLFANPARRRLEGWIKRFTERQTEDGSIPALVQIPVWSDVSYPESHGSFNGLANRVERTRAIGNGQVPGVVVSAWNHFTGQ